MVAVPVVLHGLVRPRPAGTWRLISSGAAAFPPLWPGSSTTTAFFAWVVAVADAELGGCVGAADGGTGRVLWAGRELAGGGELGRSACPLGLVSGALLHAPTAITAKTEHSHLRTGPTVPCSTALGWLDEP